MMSREILGQVIILFLRVCVCLYLRAGWDGGGDLGRVTLYFVVCIYLLRRHLDAVQLIEDFAVTLQALCVPKRIKAADIKL